jgi:hypothetical protein
MSVALSYPGIYLQELPSSTHSIIAAPTSIAVFVGYTHPFKTKTPGVPVRIFGFSDYEREFGGLYLSASVDASVAHAVYQFFLNGGSDAYVVGIIPNYQISGGSAQTITQPTATLTTTSGGIVFTALEPTDSPSITMTVTLSNVRASVLAGALDTADLTISYGTRIETFRGVLVTAPDGPINGRSTLITVAPLAGNYGTAFASATPPPIALPMPPPANLTETFSAADFTKSSTRLMCSICC